MKEAVGESAMTLITIVLVGAVITALTVIIGFLITNQSKRANCENAGYSYTGGKCMNGSQECTYNKDIDDYICG